ncbi:nucleoside hydrolase [Brevibacterium sp.]|uniref:nucleoside hydrolase n=1 Tax=Brevibacterium sp. TaxID=1701 RepID=UPI00281179CC|nr:nucleoside hydrolase [Brevibacterium sp.]
MSSDDRSIPLFLDCDPGIDDAVALAYLFCQPDVDIVGIVASGGNVPTAQVVRNTHGWIELAGRTAIPVHPGRDLPLACDDGTDSQPEYAEATHGESGAGYARLPHLHSPVSEVSAAEAWVEAARSHAGELIGVVIGPTTNLAHALTIEPELPRLVRRLFIMGGAFNYRGNTRPTTEWNVSFDPEATSRVLSSFGTAFTEGTAGHLPVIAPIEATEAIEMTPERLAEILAAGNETDSSWGELLSQLGEALRFYFEFHESDGLSFIAHLHDPFALACAISWARDHLGGSRSETALGSADPGGEITKRGAAIPIGTPGALPWSRTMFAPVDVELTGTLTRGETVADWLGRWGREANAEIIRAIDAREFLDHLGDTLKKGPPR